MILPIIKIVNRKDGSDQIWYFNECYQKHEVKKDLLSNVENFGEMR